MVQTVDVLILGGQFSSIKDSITGVISNFGKSAHVIVSCCESTATELHRYFQHHVEISFLPSEPTDEVLTAALKTKFVMIIPPLHFLYFFGISHAIELLEEHPEIDEVAGLGISTNGFLESCALNSIRDTVIGKTLQPLELGICDWTKFGEFAFTQIQSSGGLSLVRSKKIGPLGTSDTPLILRSLSRYTSNSTRVLSSGFGGIANYRLRDLFGRSGMHYKLNYADTNFTANERAIVLQHRGVLFLDHENEEAVYMSDLNVRAVDGGIIRQPLFGADYYFREHIQLQLGPGFVSVLNSFSALSRSVKSTNVDGLSSGQKSLLKLADKVAAIVPGSALNIVSKLLSKIS